MKMEIRTKYNFEFLILVSLVLKSPSNNQLPRSINWGMLVGTVPNINPRNNKQEPIKKMYLCMVDPNTK